MKTFLQSIIENIESKGIDANTATYVVPSRRVAMFLKKQIATRIKTPIFEPIIYSVEDFIAQLAGVEIASDLDLLFDFYESYKKSDTNLKKESIDEFITWAPTILKDFNEIDRFLVNTDDFFNYLFSLKELDKIHWSGIDTKTEMIDKYLHFWRQLKLYYNQFKQDCLDKKNVYQGLAYRLAFAKAELHIPNYSKEKPLIFLGLNALNKAEEEIVKIFLENSVGYIYWDCDQYFLNNNYHEAGKFLRRYKKQWKYYEDNEFSIISDSFTQTKVIEINGTAGNINMSQIAGKIINQYPLNNTDLTKTAIVLADENLLLPVLSAIGSEQSELNITMGLGLDKTAIAGYFNMLIDAQTSVHENGYYFKSIIPILESYFTKAIDTENVQELIKKIHAHNMIYIPHHYEVKKVNTSFLNLLFEPVKTPIELLNYLSTVIGELKAILIKHNKNLDLEQLLGIHSVVEQLRLFINKEHQIANIKTVQFLFKQLLALKQLDFIGKPSESLQIMGILETRALDYENIIMLSVNEGILPSGKSSNSYIPYDMKMKFGLPTYSDKDSIYAYHFYRLLQRCKKAHLIYNSQPDALGGAEKSRFILQLETSNVKLHSINKNHYSNPVNSEPLKPLSIHKDDTYFNRLNELIKKGLSPSSITSYIYNPIDFYKSKILKLQEIEEVEEDIAANTMGTIIHKSLEQLYKPFKGQKLTIKTFKKIKTLVDKVILQSYQESYLTQQEVIGKNVIIYEVAKHYVSKMISYDEQLVKKGNNLVILHLEKKYETHINLKDIGSVKLHGEIDRIDLLNDELRIIDYKTGRVDKSNVGLIPDQYDELIMDYKKSKAFQVLMYAYLYAKNESFNQCTAGIISFKNFSAGYIPYGLKTGRSYVKKIIDMQELELFEEQLINIIRELYHPEIPLIEKEN